MTLSCNTILMTGGGSGIGRRPAEETRALGNTVAIAGRHRQDLGLASVRAFGRFAAARP